MVEYERSETVPASGATVYAYVADPANLPAYISTMVRADAMSGGELHVAAILQNGVLRRHARVDLVPDVRPVAVTEQTRNVLSGPDRAADHKRPGRGLVGESSSTEHGRQAETVIRVEMRQQHQRDRMDRRGGTANQRGDRGAAVHQNPSIDEVPGVAAAGAERAATAEDGEFHLTRLAAPGRWY